MEYWRGGTATTLVIVLRPLTDLLWENDASKIPSPWRLAE